MPLVAVYTASKMAIEGFTASLAFETEAFNVRVKLVEPGYGEHSLYAEHRVALEGLIPEAYTPFAQSVFAALTQPAAVTNESDVAEAVACVPRTMPLRNSDFRRAPTQWRWLSRDEQWSRHAQDPS